MLISGCSLHELIDIATSPYVTTFVDGKRVRKRKPKDKTFVKPKLDNPMDKVKAQLRADQPKAKLKKRKSDFARQIRGTVYQ